MLPQNILFIWLRGLLSVALVLLGLYVLREWYERSQVWDVPPSATATTVASTSPSTQPPPHRVFRFEPGVNAPTALLAGALLSLLIPLGLGLLLARLLIGRAGTDDPKPTRGGTARRVAQSGGGELQVETYGRADGLPVVLTHGLGADSTQWFYAKRELGDTCRVIVWDVPGLGLSTPSEGDNYALDKIAADLRTVVRSAYEQAGNRPVLLVGHSMGGMIQLEFCNRFPDELRTTVAGVVQVDSSYTNPLRTTSKAGLYTALQKPLIEPPLHLTVWLSPLVRRLMAMSYLNGTAHLSARRSAFAGTQTRGQVDFVARYNLRCSPAVLARYMLALLRWDAAETLLGVSAPSLVVGGDRDPTCRPDASERLARERPAADPLRSLVPGRHYAFVEHHTEFARLVRDFAAARA